ncbi:MULTISPECIES: alpha/beta hydrolase [Nonomuraea]|uniref:Alpha/beta hydrolase n=1 Tax=Nonomuraea mangrovi TaxID=2316207 RepID=A0ABW4T4C7_9ACTN
MVVEERPGGSLGSRLVPLLARLFVYPLLAWTPFGLMRFAAVIDLMAVVLRPPRGTRTARVRGLGCAAEWVTAKGVDHRTGRRAGRVILYFHGGGFVLCGLRTHRRLVARLSGAAGAPVLSVAYRKPPGVPFTDTVEDCVAAYRWLLARGHAAGDIVIAGDSAGGYLGFLTPLRAVAEGLPRPAGIVALSPFIDLDHAARPGKDPYLPVSRLPALGGLLWPGILPTDPLWGPAHADLSVLPPVLIQAGSREVLRSDAELMAAALDRAGVPCRLQIWHGQVHAFQVFADLAREGMAAIGEAGAFVRTV